MREIHSIRNRLSQTTPADKSSPFRKRIDYTRDASSSGTYQNNQNPQVFHNPNPNEIKRIRGIIRGFSGEVTDKIPLNHREQTRQKRKIKWYRGARKKRSIFRGKGQKTILCVALVWSSYTECLAAVLFCSHLTFRGFWIIPDKKVDNQVEAAIHKCNHEIETAY